MSTQSAPFTVAICTFNRASSLRRTLRSLVACTSPPAGWELIVIDNNSSDQTRVVAQEFDGLLPLRYVFEPQQGLSAARNRALAEFRTDWIIFTDDDVTVDPMWLAAYASAFSEFHGAAYAGGRILPAWPDQRPKWLAHEPIALLDGLLVWFDRGTETRWFGAEDPLPYGASFALSRRSVEVHGAFRLDLGVKGGVPGRGEETEYMNRIRQAGGAGVYVGRSLVHHMTDPRRLSFRYLFRYGVQKGIAERRFGSPERGSLLKIGGYLVRGLLQVAKGRGDRFRQCIINMGIQRGLLLED